MQHFPVYVGQGFSAADRFYPIKCVTEAVVPKPFLSDGSSDLLGHGPQTPTRTTILYIYV